LKKSVFTFCFIFTLIGYHAYCQGLHFSGSRSNSLANASVCLSDVYAYHNNPANLSSIENVSIGISYENRFLMKELQNQSLAIAIPLKYGVLSFGANTFGYQNFRTFKTGAGYSMFLTKELSMGVQLNHQLLRLPEAYGINQTFTGEFGFNYSIGSDWSIGLAVFNIGRNKLTESPDDRYSTSMRLGTQYKLSDKTLILAELEKDIEHPLRSKIGIEYLPSETFAFRGGFATQPIELSFGLGWIISKKYSLDFGTQFHQILGWSPNISFKYAFIK
jgi:hypothetical protein